MLFIIDGFIFLDHSISAREGFIKGLSSIPFNYFQLHTKNTLFTSSLLYKHLKQSLLGEWSYSYFTKHKFLNRLHFWDFLLNFQCKANTLIIVKNKLLNRFRKLIVQTNLWDTLKKHVTYQIGNTINIFQKILNRTLNS